MVANVDGACHGRVVARRGIFSFQFKLERATQMALVPRKYMPDAKVVVGVLAASYVAALLFAFVPQIAPGNLVGKLGK